MAADAKQTPGQRLLLKPPGAAATLEISERQLWGKTQPRGPIPCVRIGKCIRYSPEALQAFIASQQQASQQTEEEFRQQVEDQFNAALDHPGNAGLRSHLGGEPEDGGNDDCLHPPTRTCNRCKPA